MPESNATNGSSPNTSLSWWFNHVDQFLRISNRITTPIILLAILIAIIVVAAQQAPEVVRAINAGHKDARDDFKQELANRDKVSEVVMGFMKEESKHSKDTVSLLKQQSETSKELLAELRQQTREMRQSVKKGE